MTYLTRRSRALPDGRTTLASAAAPLAHPPLFLHCGWRTRGTWLWSRFRGLPGVTAFYEPLAESLAALTPATLSRISPAGWASGHDLSQPYFEEFRPLLRPAGGVRDYRADFATADFFAAPDAALPDLERYLRGLLDTARDLGRQPVLKLCRSAGRIGWMRRRFPNAAHVVLLRDPFAQYASAAWQLARSGNAYFLTMPMLLLALHRHLPAVAAAIEALDVVLPAAARRLDLPACEATLRATGPDAWYRATLAFWLLCVAAIPDTVDLVIDGDALVHDGARRLRCEIELARLSGRLIDLSDADEREGGFPLPVAPPSEVLRVHAAAEAWLAARHGRYWADSSAPGVAAALLARARSRALGEEPRIQGRRGAGGGDGALLAALARANLAERDLAAIRASNCWRLTAPLRWLRRAAWPG